MEAEAEGAWEGAALHDVLVDGGPTAPEPEPQPSGWFRASGEAAAEDAASRAVAGAWFRGVAATRSVPDGDVEASDELNVEL